ncbi:ribbon-helix-helix domain-containing protein [Helicobacter pylori]|uniref:ribbon-helix-helix domain-containing protein n=1 Tax=Helicobacter pylori TaxID=210 RepID=UPI000413C153|nr:ribbon-helix-helix domain-containing protein [Helicobacter pylori]
MENDKNTDGTHLRATKNKLGRKPKTDANKKTRAVSLYFSDEQYHKLEQMANEEEESVGSYIKRYILKALRKIEQGGAL